MAMEIPCWSKRSASACSSVKMPGKQRRFPSTNLRQYLSTLNLCIFCLSQLLLPVSAGAAEGASSGPGKGILLVLAYMAMWIGFAVFGYFIHMSLRKTKDEVEWLGRQLDDKERSADKPEDPASSPW